MSKTVQPTKVKTSVVTIFTRNYTATRKALSTAAVTVTDVSTTTLFQAEAPLSLFTTVTEVETITVTISPSIPGDVTVTQEAQDFETEIIVFTLSSTCPATTTSFATVEYDFTTTVSQLDTETLSTSVYAIVTATAATTVTQTTTTVSFLTVPTTITYTNTILTTIPNEIDITSTRIVTVSTKVTSLQHSLVTSFLALHYGAAVGKRNLDNAEKRGAKSYPMSVLCTENDYVYVSSTRTVTPKTLTMTSTQTVIKTIIVFGPSVTTTVTKLAASTLTVLSTSTTIATEIIVATTSVSPSNGSMATSTVTETLLTSVTVLGAAPDGLTITQAHTSTVTSTRLSTVTTLTTIYEQEDYTLTSFETVPVTANIAITENEFITFSSLVLETTTISTDITMAWTSTLYVPTTITVDSGQTTVQPFTSILQATTTTTSTSIFAPTVTNVIKKYLPDYFLSGQTSFGYLNLSIVVGRDGDNCGFSGRPVIDVYGTLDGSPVSFDNFQLFYDPDNCLTPLRWPYFSSNGIDFSTGSQIYNLRALYSVSTVLDSIGYMSGVLGQYTTTPSGPGIERDSASFQPVLTIAPGTSVISISPTVSAYSLVIFYMSLYTTRFSVIHLKIYTLRTTSNDLCPYSIVDMIGTLNDGTLTLLDNWDSSIVFQAPDNCILYDLNDPTSAYFSGTGIDFSVGGKPYNAYVMKSDREVYVTGPDLYNEKAYAKSISTTPPDIFADCQPLAGICRQSKSWQPQCYGGQTYDPKVVSQCSFQLYEQSPYVTDGMST